MSWMLINTYKKWYKLAVIKVCAVAQSNFSYLCMKGFGVKKVYKESIRLCCSSAALTPPVGQNNLAVLYDHGWGVWPDRARSLFSLAAEQGHAKAKENLAVIDN
jgi:TPR repeat protein